MVQTKAEVQRAQEDSREQIARFMIASGIATGHGDTTEDLLGEIGAEIARLRESLKFLQLECDNRTSAYEVLVKVCGELRRALAGFAHEADCGCWQTDTEGNVFFEARACDCFKSRLLIESAKIP